MEQACLQEEEWKKKMEKLNEKYGLDCFSNSELDSESDEEESMGMNITMRHSYSDILNNDCICFCIIEVV